jgi:hypothetical protein
MEYHSFHRWSGTSSSAAQPSVSGAARKSSASTGKPVEASSPRAEVSRSSERFRALHHVGRRSGIPVLGPFPLAHYPSKVFPLQQPSRVAAVRAPSPLAVRRFVFLLLPAFRFCDPSGVDLEALLR